MINSGKILQLCAISALVLVTARLTATAASLTASLDRNVVTLGESVTLTLTVQNANIRNAPNLPPIANVTVAGVGSGQSSGFTIGANGQTLQTESKISFNYTLLASQVGEVTIPPVRLQVDGQELTTQLLKFRVQAAPPTPPEAANKTAFLKLVVPKTELFVGEAQPVDVNLYVMELGEGHLPQIQSPGVTVGKVVQQAQTRTRVGNQVFNLLSFKTFIAAVRPGAFPLGPATMQVVIPKPNARRDIFGRIADWQNVTLSSEAQNLNVLPLPTTNVPPTFNGAVGSFSMIASAGPTNVALGDPITVRVAISGQGLLDSVILPNQPAWADFKVYPPNSRVDPSDQFGLSGTKTFEQVVIAQKQETTLLPPVQFSFFDPTARDYRTLSGPAVALSVRPAGAVGSLPSLNLPGQTPTVTNDEIVHIKPYLGVSPVVGAPLIQQPWFLALQGVPLLTWLSLLILRKRNESLARNPRLRRQREVARKISEGLTELRRQATAQESDAFFANVFRLLQEQLGERLDLPASAITEAVIEERLRHRNLREQTLTGLHSLFQVCNQARYAPVRSKHELNSFLSRVETMLTELQKIEA